jgi:hypothetical protein
MAINDYFIMAIGGYFKLYYDYLWLFYCKLLLDISNCIIISYW